MMSSDANSRTPKIRTFASDLAEARENRPDHDHTKKTSGTKKSEVQILAAPTRSSKPDHEAKPIPKKDQPKIKPIPEKKAGGKQQSVIKPIPKKKVVDNKQFGTNDKKQNTASSEIDKQVAVLNKQTEVSEGTPAKTGKQKQRPNIGYDATIITDTKRNSFRLIPSIIESFSDWLESLLKKHKKQAPKYTVEQATRRKGVIQRATTKSGSIFTADSDEIKDRIKRRQSQPPKTKDEAHTFWTPFTEIGYRLLERESAPEHKPHNVSLEFRKPTSPENISEVDDHYLDKTDPEEAEEETTITESVEEKIEEPPTNTEPETADDIRWQQPETEPKQSAVASVSPASEEVGEPLQPIPEAKETEEKIRPDQEIEELEETKDSTSHSDDSPDEDITGLKNNYLKNTDTNTLTISIALIILCLLIIGITGKIIWEYITDTPTTISQVQVESTIEKIVPDAELIPVTLTNGNLDSLLGAVDESISSSPSRITEVAIVSRQNEEVSPSYIFNQFEFNTLPTLTQSLISVRFVALDNKKPNLVFNFVDELTVKGGMLFWESIMASDLQNIFTNLPATSQKFTDKTIRNVDARVLESNEGFILGYVIIDDKVIVSSSEDDLIELIGLINN